MLSSDKNVENIAQLIEVLKHYLELEGEYAKLTLIDKVVRLGTAIALAIIFIILALAVFMFFWIGIAFWLSHLIGLTAAFLFVSAAHLVLLLLFFIFRKSWIERPLVQFLASLLLS
jgi:uncharacterized protein YqhQ